jgi:hypothetical protein
MENLCFFWGRSEVTCNLDESTLKRVSCQPLTSETWVKSPVSLGVLLVDKRAQRADCPLSVNPKRPLLFFLLLLWEGRAGLSWEPSKKAIVFRKIFRKATTRFRTCRTAVASSVGLSVFVVLYNVTDWPSVKVAEAAVAMSPKLQQRGNASGHS